jgi:hypothetical protein
MTEERIIRRSDKEAGAEALPCDACVVGGGTAGIAAAVAAARHGARTVLLEQGGTLGGTQTGGLVTPMMRSQIGEDPLVLGLHAELLRRYAEREPDWGEKTSDYLFFNPVTLACLFDDLVSEAGVDVRFETVLVDVERREQRLTHLTAVTPTGPLRVEAQVYIDCTGDADLAYLAGLPLFSGRAGDARNQPMALRFLMADVDLERLQAFMIERDENFTPRLPRFEIGYGELKNSPLADLVEQAIAAGVLERDDLGYFQLFAMLGRPGEVAFNCPRIHGLSPLDSRDRSEAWQRGRAMIHRIATFCGRYLPGFEAAYISMIAPMLGVRESRRLKGAYVLTGEDIYGCVKFEDGVACNNYPVDIHDPDGKDTTMKHLPPGEYHSIPYRSLLPAEPLNLLAAGRNLSATFEAQASVRIQPVCRALGEAAGAAAALSVQQEILPTALDPQILRETLRKAGCRVD